MPFLIGVIILIVFILLLIIYLRFRINSILNRMGLGGMNIKEIVEEARIQDQDVPKSLSSMDRVYLDTIKKDFPNININELKRQSEKIITDCYMGAQKKDTSGLKGKMKSFTETLIANAHGKDVSYDDFKIHNTVVAKYQKEAGIATIYFASSYEYYLVTGESRVKRQDRAKTEFIYVYDTKKVDLDKKVLGIHCPNCGSPITSLGQKECSYCGTVAIELIGRVFTCNDIVRY